MKRFLIIADDFTGANDTGVQFTKRGIPTQVVFQGVQSESSELALVIDTETRGMSGPEAYERVKELSKTVQIDSFNCVYKKIDSTLRGNVVEEIRAVCEVYEPELIIFAPAYPSNNRTTVEGVQHMNGVPVSKTEVGRDPKKPVQEDNIINLLSRAVCGQVSHISLEKIRSGNMEFSVGKAFTIDAEEKEDLIPVVEKANLENKKTLWIGSAGLAEAIMTVSIPIKPVLCIAGSISEVSRSQVQFAASRGADIIKADIAGIMKGNNISDVADECIESLKKGKDTILVSSCSREDYEECVRLGSKLGMTKEEVSLYTQITLGRIAEKILKETGAAGLFLTGGDTAVEVIRRIDANGSKLLQELLPGIPLMRLQGGPFDGLPVVTKAGAFGQADALDYCIRRLKEAVS